MVQCGKHYQILGFRGKISIDYPVQGNLFYMRMVSSLTRRTSKRRLFSTRSNRASSVLILILKQKWHAIHSSIYHHARTCIPFNDSIIYRYIRTCMFHYTWQEKGGDKRENKADISQQKNKDIWRQEANVLSIPNALFTARRSADVSTIMLPWTVASNSIYERFSQYNNLPILISYSVLQHTCIRRKFSAKCSVLIPKQVIMFDVISNIPAVGSE